MSQNHRADQAQKLLNELKARQLFNDCTNEAKLIKALSHNGLTYLGFDPTAPSLHLGNYVGIVLLKLFQKYGFKTCVLIGGATGLIGDPSFKHQERQLLSPKLVDKHACKITEQLTKLLAVDLVVNNRVFYQSMNVISFLRDLGKLVNVNYLLEKESLKTRLSTGLSYTEFTYPLLQGWDFLNLYQNYKVMIQLGGSDQWGNITTGIQMIKKIHGENVLVSGLTFKILTDQHGNKFGKSEGNALFLDPELTHPYVIYQFLINTDDDQLTKYLLALTELPINTIYKLINDHDPKLRKGQQTLAYELIKTVFNISTANNCVALSQKLFYGHFDQLTNDDYAGLAQVLPTITISEPIKITQALLDTGLVSSLTAGKQLITSHGIGIFNQKITDVHMIITRDLGEYLLLKKGKRKYGLVRWTNK